MKTSEEIIAEIKQLLKENKERSWVNDSANSSSTCIEDWHEEDLICVEVYRVLTKLLRFTNENK